MQEMKLFYNNSYLCIFFPENNIFKNLFNLNVSEKHISANNSILLQEL